MGGSPTPVRTTGGTPASGWLDLCKVSVTQRRREAFSASFVLGGMNHEEAKDTKEEEEEEGERSFCVKSFRMLVL
jgi:hypothetical protein